MESDSDDLTDNDDVDGDLYSDNQHESVHAEQSENDDQIIEEFVDDDDGEPVAGLIRVIEPTIE